MKPTKTHAPEKPKTTLSKAASTAASSETVANRDAPASSKPGKRTGAVTKQKSAPQGKKAKATTSNTAKRTTEQKSAPPSKKSKATQRATEQAIKVATGLALYGDLAQPDPRVRAAAAAALLAGLEKEQAEYESTLEPDLVARARGSAMDQSDDGDGERNETTAADEKLRAAAADLGFGMDELSDHEDESVKATRTAKEKKKKQAADEEKRAKAEAIEQKLKDKAAASGVSALWSPSLNYAVKRLLRGLMSSRLSARQGFSLALAELLRRLPVLSDDTGSVLKLAKQHIAIPAAAKRQEKRDYYCGRVFFALVLCKSGQIPKLGAARSLEFVRELLGVAEQSPPLREMAFEGVAHIAHEVSFADFRSIILPELLKLFEGKTQAEWSAELLSLSLAIGDRFQAEGESAEQLPSEMRKPLAAKRLPSLLRALEETTWTMPKVHAVWTRIFDRLFAQQPENEEGAQSAVQLKADALWTNFWQTAVDHHLLSSTSHARKQLGLSLFQMAARKIIVPAQAGSSAAADWRLRRLPVLFGRGFLRTFINHLSKHDNTLHNDAKQCRDTLLSLCAANSAAGLLVVNGLTDEQQGGSRSFDARTRSRLVEGILTHLDAEAVESYVQHLLGLFATSSNEEAQKLAPARGKKAADAEDEPEEKQEKSPLDFLRRWCADQLYLVSRNRQLAQSAEEKPWLASIVQFFLFYGFFRSFAPQSDGSLRPVPLPSLSEKKSKAKQKQKDSQQKDELVAADDELRTLCSRLLFSLLADLQAKSRGAREGEGKEREEEEKEKEKGQRSVWAERVQQQWRAMEQQGYALAEQLSERQSKVRERLQQENERMNAQIATLEAEVSAAAAEAKAESAEKEEKRALTVSLHKLQQAKAVQELATHLAVFQLIEDNDNENEKAAEGEDEEGAQRQTAALDDLLTRLERDQQQQQQPKSNGNTLFCLHAVIAEAKSKKAKKGEQKGDEEKADEAEVPFVEFITDLLLGLLSEPSQLLRELCKRVFAAFTAEMTAGALRLLCDVLISQDEKPQKTSLEPDDDMQPMTEEEKAQAKAARKAARAELDAKRKAEKEAEAEGKAEEKKAKDKGKEKKEKTQKSADSDAEMSEGEQEDEEKISMEQLNAVLSADLSPEEEEAVRSASSAEGSEAEIEEYDRRLAEVLKHSKEAKEQAKKELKEAKQDRLHFKLRVLDLVETFLKRQRRSPLLVQLLAPLLETIARSAAPEKKPLAARAENLLKNQLCKSKQPPRMTSAEDIESVRALMEDLLTKAKKTTRRDLLALHSAALLFLVRVSLPTQSPTQTQTQSQTETEAAAKAKKKKSKKAAANGDENEGETKASTEDDHAAWVTTLYQSALDHALMKKHSLLNTKFFLDYIERFPLLGMRLANALVGCASDASSEFNKSEAALLLEKVLSSKHAQSNGELLTSLAPKLSAALATSLEKAVADSKQPAEEKESEEPDEEKQEPGKKSKKRKAKKAKQGDKACARRLATLIRACRALLAALNRAAQTQPALAEVRSSFIEPSSPIRGALETLPPSLLEPCRNDIKNFAKLAQWDLVLPERPVQRKTPNATATTSTKTKTKSQANANENSQANHKHKDKSKKGQKRKADSEAEQAADAAKGANGAGNSGSAKKQRKTQSAKGRAGDERKSAAKDKPRTEHKASSKAKGKAKVKADITANDLSKPKAALGKKRPRQDDGNGKSADAPKKGAKRNKTSDE